MTRFCAEVFSLATSEKTLTGIASVLKLNRRDFGTEHYTCCTEIIFALAKIVLQTLASKFDGGVSEPFKSLKNMTADEKGKIRYVGGWTFRTVLQGTRSYIDKNICSTQPSVRNQLRTEIMKLRIVESLLASSAALHEHSSYKESLEITDEKQNASVGLLNISDNAFLFLTKLEEFRINSLTQNKLNMLKGDIVIKAVDKVKTNIELYQARREIADDIQSLLTEDKTEKVELFNICVNSLFNEIIVKYFKMGAGEFLRDFGEMLSGRRLKLTEKKYR